MACPLPLWTRLWFEAYLGLHGIPVKDPEVQSVCRQSVYGCRIEGSLDESTIWDAASNRYYTVSFNRAYVNRLPSSMKLFYEAQRMNLATLEAMKRGELPEGYAALCRRFDESLVPRFTTDFQVTAARTGETGPWEKPSRRDLITAAWLFADILGKNVRAQEFLRLHWGERLDELNPTLSDVKFLPTLSFVAQHVSFTARAVFEPMAAAEARQALLRWMPPVLTSRVSEVKKDVPDAVSMKLTGRRLSNLSKFFGAFHERASEEAGKWLKNALRTTSTEVPQKTIKNQWDPYEGSRNFTDAVLVATGCESVPWHFVFSKSTARTAAACADDFLRDCEWPEETESFACEPFHRAAAALTTMPRWRAESVGDALLFWRAVARAGAAVAESAQWRLQGVATGNLDRYGSALLYAPSLEIPEVKAVFEELCAMAAPFEEKLFAAPFAREAERRIEARVYAAWVLMTTAAVGDALGRRPMRIIEDRYDGMAAAQFPDIYDDDWQNFYEWAGRLSALRVDRTEDGGLKLKLGFMRLMQQGRAQRFVPYQSANQQEKARLAACAEALGQLPDALCGFFAAKNIDKTQLTVTVAPSLLADFIFEAIPRLQKHGFYFDTAESFFRLTKPRVVARVTEGEGLLHGLLDKKALSDFSWEAAVGDTVLSRAELDSVLKRTGEVFSYGDAFLYLTEEEAQAIRKQLDAPHRLNVWDKLRAVLAGSVKGIEVMTSASLRTKLAEIFRVEDQPVPPGLTAQLRPYQVKGYSWLVKNLSLGLGALIADDMGLGKTVQVIAALQYLKDQGELADERVLVVAPASLLTNWQREIARFAPNLTTEIYHGLAREIAENVADSDVVITSYGILRRDLTPLSLRSWRLLVLDEAQSVKNWASSQAEAARLFPARQVIAMTGTPVENSLSEYWSVLSTVQPGLLGGRTEFMRDYGKPIEERMDRRALERFRQLTTPFILRRVKTDKNVIADLPEKNEIDYFTSLTPQQVKLYEECLKTGLTDAETLTREAEAQADETMKAVAQNLRMKRKGAILRMITHLKQIADSPSLFAKTAAETADSGKGEALLSLLGPSVEAGNKILIFTQYAEMGTRLVSWIEKAGFRRPDFLEGATPVAERTKMVDRFQNDPKADILVLTLKAGGTGLNLTAASVVIHYDLWWNPAVEAQATDRAYRIGQTKEVLVYRFITAGTFEEKIDKLLVNKKRLADMTVAGSEKWIGDMTDQELASLFSLS